MKTMTSPLEVSKLLQSAKDGFPNYCLDDLHEICSSLIPELESGFLDLKQCLARIEICCQALSSGVVFATGNGLVADLDNTQHWLVRFDKVLESLRSRSEVPATVISNYQSHTQNRLKVVENSIRAIDKLSEQAIGFEATDEPLQLVKPR